MKGRFATLAALLLFAAPTAGAPNGNGKVAFASGGIQVSNTDGSGRTNLTPTISTAVRPVWSPAGSQIAFLVVGADEVDGYQPAGELWVVNGDGTGLRQLVALEAHGHSWSPDGTRIAFLASGDVHVVDVAGGEVKRLTPDGGSKSPPSWSPDGTKLVYARYRRSISVIESGDGTLIHEHAIEGAWNAAWSPDGTRIAFMRIASSPTYTIGDLNLISPDGTGRRTISGDLVQASVPSWSPDGTRLLLSASGGWQGSGAGSLPLGEEVGVVPVDGSGAWFLTRGRGGFSPVWSPDGTRVAFTSNRTGRPQVFVANAVGSCPTQLTGLDPRSPKAFSPSWQALSGAPPSPPLRCADLVLDAKSRAVTVPRRSDVQLRFTLDVEGNEPATAPRVVAELPPTLVALGRSGGGCVVERHRISCELPRAEGVTHVIDLSVRPARTGRGTVRITARAREPDGDLSNNILLLRYEVSRCTVLGTARGDVLAGTSRDDLICGLDGGDRLLGRAGDDRLLGGAGADTIFDGAGRDNVSGGNGADVIVSEDRQSDSIDCGRGADRVVADRRDRVARNCERVVWR